MATTTPNYGWPVPTSTDLVKDGAVAIEALGDAIDATVFGLPSGALSLVNTTTIGTTVSSIAVNNVFTATYQNYLVIFNFDTTTTSTVTSLLFRLRKAGTSNSANEYKANGYVSTSSLTNDNLNSTSQIFGLVNNSFPDNSSATITFYSPQKNSKTGYKYDAMGVDGTPVQHARVGNGYHNVLNNYDGFEIIVNSGTMSGGTIRTYGYGI